MSATLLADPADFAAVRGVDYDPTDLSALISLEGASAAVQTYTGQTLALVEDDTVRIHGTGTASLLLPQLPVGTISDVTVTDSAGTDTTLTEDTDFTVESDSGILWRKPWLCWIPGRLNVSVTYTHGYDPIPPDIQMVVMALAGRSYTRSQTGGRLVTAETLGPYSVTFDTTTTATEEGGLLDLERAVLDRYRLNRVV